MRTPSLPPPGWPASAWLRYRVLHSRHAFKLSKERAKLIAAIEIDRVRWTPLPNTLTTLDRLTH